MVHVAVCVEGDRERRVAPCADQLVDGAGRVREARIDEDEAAARAERVGVHERAVHEHVGRHLGRRAEELELRVRRIGRHHLVRRHGVGLYPSGATGGKPEAEEV